MNDRDISNLKRNIAGIVYQLIAIGSPNAELDLPNGETILGYNEEEIRFWFSILLILFIINTFFYFLTSINLKY